MFPVPRFTALRGGGLEVSDHSVKHLVLKKVHSYSSTSSFRLASFGSERIPEGVVSGGEIHNPEALRAILMRVREKMGQPFVDVSLPEQKGYVFQVSFPVSEDLSLRHAITFLLEERVPLSASDTTFDYEIMPESSSREIKVTVTAFPRKLVELQHDILREAGFRPLSFEMESQAAARALVPPDGKTRMIVDFGDTRTSVSVVGGGIVRFTTSLDIGGGSLQSALQKALGVDAEEADRLKNEQGILALNQGNPVAEALISTLSALRDEIGRRFAYWHTHATEENREASTIEEILLIGGNANLRGFSDYLEQSLRVPVRQPNVWGNLCTFDSYVPPIERTESFRYATVVGLALRAFSGTL